MPHRRLYNKDAVLEALLSRSPRLLELSPHIRSRHDVIELHLTPNPAHAAATGTAVASGAAVAGAPLDDGAAPHMCPVTHLEMSGYYGFCFLRSCGCVLSEKALREVPSSTCLRCEKPFVADDVIAINGTREEVDALRARMQARRARAKQARRPARAAAPEANEQPTRSAMEESSKPLPAPRIHLPAGGSALVSEVARAAEKAAERSLRTGSMAYQSLFAPSTGTPQDGTVARAH